MRPTQLVVALMLFCCVASAASLSYDSVNSVLIKQDASANAKTLASIILMNKVVNESGRLTLTDCDMFTCRVVLQVTPKFDYALTNKDLTGSVRFSKLGKTSLSSVEIWDTRLETLSVPNIIDKTCIFTDAELDEPIAGAAMVTRRELGVTTYNCSYVDGEKLEYRNVTAWYSLYTYSFKANAAYLVSLVYSRSSADDVADLIPSIFRTSISRWAWWNTTWIYVYPITVNSTVTSNLTLIPIAVSLNTSNSTLWNTTTCTNVRFVASDNATLLNYDLDDKSNVFCGNATNNATFWVGVNTTNSSAGVNTIYAYLGNVGAASGENAVFLWRNASYNAVYHLNATGTQTDESGRGNALTQKGSNCTTVAGKYGNAIAFLSNQTAGCDATSYYCAFEKSAPADLASAAAASTESGWVYTGSVINNPDMAWNIGSNNGATTDRGLILVNASNSVFNLTYFGRNNYSVSNIATPIGSWYYLASKYDGATAYVIRNTTTYSAALSLATTANNMLRIGMHVEATTNCFLVHNSTIDEARFANVSRTADWLAAEYGAVASVGALVTYATNVVINSPANATNYSAGTASADINFTVSGATAPYNCSVVRNGTVNATNASVSEATPTVLATTGLLNGTNYTFYVSCNSSGTIGNSSTYWFFVNTTTPTVAINSPANTTNYSSGTTTVPVNFTATLNTSNGGSGGGSGAGQASAGEFNITIDTPLGTAFKDPWYNSTFLYYAPVSINSTVTSNLTNFPCMVVVDTTNATLFNTTTCTNIRFTASDNATVLNYELDSGCNTSTTLYWVGCNLTDSSVSNTTLGLWGGNIVAASGENAVFLWRNGSYYSAWHMNSILNLTDSAGINNLPRTVNTTCALNTTGGVGNGIYTGTTGCTYGSNSVTIPSGNNPVTVTVWGTNGGSDDSPIFNFGCQLTHNAVGMTYSLNTTSVSSFSNPYVNNRIDVVHSTHTNQHFGAVRDLGNGTRTLYYDMNASSSTAVTPAYAGAGIVIGGWAWNGGACGLGQTYGIGKQKTLYEIRFRNASSTVDWLVAEMNQTSSVGAWITVATVVVINSPANATNYSSGTTTVPVNFTASGASTPYNCSLYINSTLNATNSSVAEATATVLNATGLANATNYTFYISCIDANNVVGNSTTQWFYVNASSEYSAVGCTKTTDDLYTVHTCNSNSSFNVTGTINATVLVVAGGGGGGRDCWGGVRSAGGGGAGGLLYNTSYNATGNITVVIGNGGVGGAGCADSSIVNGRNGTNSSFGTIVARGGGGGSGHDSGDGSENACYIGGSGGAGSNCGTGCNGTSGQGNTGGNGCLCYSPYRGGGGGGGAGAAGQNSPDASTGGIGGVGLNYTIYNGTSLAYAGGGGGTSSTGTVAGGVGGGGASNAAGTGTNGTANTGGGGGAARGGNGGAGGSGIVIIRYLTYVAPGGDTAAPTYSSNTTNTTLAGASTLFSLAWADNVALSGYIFSWDNGTGTLVNGTWTAMIGASNWSNVTKVVNTTVGSTIKWCVYANDSSNNLNSTSCVTPFSYTTGSFVDTSISPASIAFGSLDPGTTYNAMTSNPLVLTNTANSNVAIDTYLQATALTGGGNTIAVTNLYVSQTSGGAKTALVSASYLSGAEPNQGYSENLAVSGTQNLYFWLSVPAGQLSGSYTGTATLKSVANGLTP